MAGNDIQNMSNSTRNILSNKEVILVDQDSLDIQSLRWLVYDEREI